MGVAFGLVGRHLGSPGRGTFLLALNGAGELESLSFLEPPGGWHLRCEEWNAVGKSYLFLDPFEAPEFTFLAWAGIERGVMERLLGEPFSDGDFERFSSASSRAGKLPEAGAFPTTWSVMF